MTANKREAHGAGGGVYIPGYTLPINIIIFDKICIIQVRLGYNAEILSPSHLSPPPKGLRQHTAFNGYLNAFLGKF